MAVNRCKCPLYLLLVTGQPAQIVCAHSRQPRLSLYCMLATDGTQRRFGLHLHREIPSEAVDLLERLVVHRR